MGKNSTSSTLYYVKCWGDDACWLQHFSIRSKFSRSLLGTSPTKSPYLLNIPSIAPSSPGYSIILDETARPGHGPIHRSVIKAINTIKHDPSINDPRHSVGLSFSPMESMYHNFMHSAKKHATYPCCGVQPIENGIVQPFVWTRYQEVKDRIDNLGSGIAHRNLLPPILGQRICAIYMHNSMEWMISEYAVYSQSSTIVALYDSLGADSAEYILNQTELPTVICTVVELKKLIRLKERCKHLKYAIICEASDSQIEAEALTVGLQCYRMRDLEAIGKSHPTPPTPPKPSDIATIMYTSGTTGDPKGVMLSHFTLLSTVQASLDHLLHYNMQSFNTSTHYLSYLPLAHIMERCAQAIVYDVGGRVGYSQGNPLKLVDDLKALRPTFFLTVPRLLNRIYDQIMGKMRLEQSKIKKYLFFKALNTKLHLLKTKKQTTHKFWDKLIFYKLAGQLGLDRVELILSGSAPLSADVMGFMRVAFPNAKCGEGYGQTESCGGIVLSAPCDTMNGYVGGPTTNAEIKLEAIPEMGYYETDREHGDDKIPCRGRGEICIRGPCVFDGYFKLPEKTAETIDADGWLHTGDVGLWSTEGHLRIIDRKKNIFKLSQGEYVAPEKLENIFIACPSVGQIFVTGDSFHSHLVAIVVPDEAVFRAMATNNGFTRATAFKELCESPVLKKLVQAELEEVSVKSRLAGFERCKQIYLHHELFSVENDLLTPTFKLKRNEAQKYFKRQIQAMYEASGDAVAGQIKTAW